MRENESLIEAVYSYEFVIPASAVDHACLRHGAGRTGTLTM